LRDFLQKIIDLNRNLNRIDLNRPTLGLIQSNLTWINSGKG